MGGRGGPPSLKGGGESKLYPPRGGGTVEIVPDGTGRRLLLEGGKKNKKVSPQFL